MVGDSKHEIRTRGEWVCLSYRRGEWQGMGWGRAHHRGLLSEGILSEEELSLQGGAPVGRTRPQTRPTALKLP